jgi:hypothetical protein
LLAALALLTEVYAAIVTRASGELRPQPPPAIQPALQHRSR